jgi:thioredoxin reductase (NADPH)
MARFKKCSSVFVAGLPLVPSFSAFPRLRPFGSVPHLPTQLHSHEEDGFSDRFADTFRQFEYLAEQTYSEQYAELENIADSLDQISMRSNQANSPLWNSFSSDFSSFDTPDNRGGELGDVFGGAGPEEEEMPIMGAPEMVECDVAIVGGGPAGLTCALYTARAGLRTVVLDKNPALGALAITSHIANYPGVDRSLTGEELLGTIRQQAIDYGTDYRQAQVFMIDMQEEDGEEIGYSKTVYTPDAIVKARALVLATGAMGRVAAPFPGEDTYLGQGVSYCATCDGAFYRDAEVAVKGMNLEAMEEASFLAKFAKTVHWVTPSRPRPEQDQHVKDLLACGNVKKWQLTRLISVEGDVTGVTGIKVKQKNSEEPEIIPVEGVFIYAGGGGGSKPITDYIGSSTIMFKVCLRSEISATRPTNRWW